MNQVDIIAGARLHFGLLCGPPGSRWHYGGLGLMLQSPSWNVNVAHCTGAKDDLSDLSSSVADRAEKLLREFRKHWPDLPAVRVSTRHEVDGHAGLGSGTQLTLLLATALTLLSGQPRPASVELLATQLGRSQRSAIGTYGFDHGGFIVDEGRHINNVHRIAFPEEWRMVLLTPTVGEGMSGSSEEAFFGKREFLPAATIAEFEHLIVDRIVPALKRSDLPEFRESLAIYGELVGQYYAAAQGGVFSNAVIRDVTNRLELEGITGAVQSSWGPTVCIPVANDGEARAIQKAVASQSRGQPLTATIAQPLNTGATVTTAAPSTDDYRSFG